MKLVDNDEVVRIVREEVKDEDNTLPVSFRAGVDYVLKIMNELPTVDAIPIEWIEKYIDSTLDEGNSQMLGFKAAIIKEMIEELEKENE